MQSLGVLGGTFDPVHYGHLRLALEMCDRLALSEGVRLVPAAAPALRDEPRATPGQRVHMLETAVAGCEALLVDRREIERPGPSYTVDTLASLREELPDASICFILGMDAFSQLPRWHRWQEILALAHIAVAARPGASYPSDATLRRFVEAHRTEDPAMLGCRPAGHVCLVDVPSLDVSATYVRRLVAAHRSPRYLLPDAVLGIIEQQGVYLES